MPVSMVYMFASILEVDVPVVVVVVDDGYEVVKAWMGYKNNRLVGFEGGPFFFFLRSPKTSHQTHSHFKLSPCRESRSLLFVATNLVDLHPSLTDRANKETRKKNKNRDGREQAHGYRQHAVARRGPESGRGLHRHSS